MTADKPCTADAMLVLELATENALLRAQLAETQDQCIELAVDAGELHTEIEALRAEVEQLRANAAMQRVA